MKKAGVFIAIFLINLMILSSFASAQAAQQYSGFARFGDNVRLVFAKGDDKVKLALEIREKELNSALENAKAGNSEDAIKNFESASDKLGIVQEQTSPDVAEDIRISVEEIEARIMENKNLTPEFAAYLEKHLTEEEKTRLSAELSEKLSDYCSSLAEQDYELMIKDEKCNPENAPEWLKKDIDKKTKEMQEEVADEMIKQLTTCINDPRECDCSKIPVVSEQAKCEKGKALAIRCEFQNDMSACDQLDEMKPEVPSNMPAFLKPMFEKTMNEAIKKKEKEMFNKLAPKECIEAGATTREECEKIMMEKFAPQECIEAGATTKEACEQIMFAKYGPPPTECTENGQFIGPEECEQKMVESGKIPQECVENGKFIGREECEQKMISSGMIPEECIKDGRPISEQECRKIMEEKGMESAGEGQIPEECIKDGQPVSPDECMEIMQERGIQPQQGQMQPKTGGMSGGKGSKWKGSQKIPQECVGMTFDECEQHLMQNYIPKECQDANALTPEACEKIMLPGDCKEAGAFTGQECEAVMIKKNMPKECQDANALTPDECAKAMSKSVVVFSKGSELDFLSKKGISFEQVPDACKQGSNFVRGMECDKALAGMGISLPVPQDISNIPKECMKDGQPVSPDECHEILKSKLVNENIPGPCREAGITTPDECGKFMDKERKDEGIGINMPQECMGKSPEECRTIMEEKGIRVERGERAERIGQIERECKEGEEECERRIQQLEEREKVRMPRECADMGISDSSSCDILMSKINEERMKNGDKMIVDQEGNQDYITNDQINKIAEEAEKRAGEIRPNTEEAQEIRQEMEYVESRIEQAEQHGEQIELPPAEEFGQPSQAPESASESSSAPESSSSSSSEPSSSTSEAASSSEPAPATGEAISESSGNKQIILRFLDFIFGRR